MKKSCIFAAVAAWFLISSTHALDASDHATYVVVHKDGHLTNSSFRVSQTRGQWKLENRLPDGRWDDVTCEGDCKLRESQVEHINGFFSTKDLEQINPDCVHNKAFAFCKYSLRTDSAFRGYLFVALVGPQPITIRLARVGT